MAGPGLGCATLATFNIVDANPVITINDLGIHHKDFCAPANGSATVLRVLEDGVPKSTAPYEFTWLQSDGVTRSLPATLDSLFAGLDVGNYYVRAFNTVSLCTSANTFFQINDSTQNPVITDNIIANSNCVGINPNGSITIDIDAGAATTGYNIAWLESDSSALGSITTSAIIINDTTAAQLPHGQYRLTVVDTLGKYLNCYTERLFNLAPDTAQLAITNRILIANTNCAPGNGALQVTEVTEDMVAYPANNGDYDFQWFDNTLASLAGPAASVLFDSLDNGNYFVMARNVNSNCFSPTLPFTIIQNTSNPALDNFSIVDNSNCGVANANGQVNIQVDTAANYAFHGLSPIPPLSGPLPPLLSLTPIPPYPDCSHVSISYEVTDTTGANLGCLSHFAFTVGSGISSMVINNLAVINKSNCSPANGGANVIQIMEDSVLYPAGSGDYQFEWFNAAAYFHCRTRCPDFCRRAGYRALPGYELPISLQLYFPVTGSLMSSRLLLILPSLPTW